jgi:hypothetical protein
MEWGINTREKERAAKRLEFLLKWGEERRWRYGEEKGGKREGRRIWCPR